MKIVRNGRYMGKTLNNFKFLDEDSFITYIPKTIMLGPDDQPRFARKIKITIEWED